MLYYNWTLNMNNNSLTMHTTVHVGMCQYIMELADGQKKSRNNM